MGSPGVSRDQKRATPRLFRARMGGLVFALAVVLVAIWLLSRLQ